MPTNAELEAYLARQGLVYRLPELVRQKALHEQGSPYRLEKVIEHFCKARNIPGEISRHVLTGLAEHPLSSSINLKQLLALDAYFAQGGRGFDQIPILRRVSLVDALRAEVAAAILIAAKPTQPNQTHYTRAAFPRARPRPSPPPRRRRRRIDADTTRTAPAPRRSTSCWDRSGRAGAMPRRNGIG